MNKKRYKGRSVLAIILLCMFFCFELSAQNVRFSFEKTPIKTILVDVSEKTGFKFIYSNALHVVNNSVNFNLETDKNNIDIILKELFKDNSVSWKITGNQVVIAPLEIISSNNVNKVGGTVLSGSVLDESTGEPVPGVAVKNSRTNEVVIANELGEFSIDAAKGDVLQFSSIGMKNVDYSVTRTDRNITIFMDTDLISLSDVVVTGYQTISKERATGSYNIVKAEQLNKPSTNIAQRLVGTTAGLQSSTDAEGNISFEIRGQSSLLANAQPLIVIDGFPTQDSFESINPNDVESITVLKDAAAASIWGAKSANGVIVITTKKGSDVQKGMVNVDVSAFWKFSPKIDWEYVNPLATSAEIIDYEKRGYSTNGFFGSAYWLPNQDIYQDIYSHSLAVTAINEYNLGYLSESEMNAELQRLSKLDNTDQIKKYMLDNPFTQQYNVTISGSTERSNNMLSLMYEGMDKYLKGNSHNKYNVGYRTNVKLFKWLDFNFSGNYSMTDSKNNAAGLDEISALSRYQMLVNEDGSLARDYGNYYGPNIQRHVPTSSFPYSDWTQNIIEDREGRDYSSKRTAVRAQGGLTAKIIKGLNVESKIQYELIDYYTKNIDNETTSYVRNTVNQASTWNKTTGQVTANLPKGGIMAQNKSSVDSWNWRSQINFDRGFNDNKHQISVIAGTELSSIITQGTVYATTYGYNDDKLTVGTFPNGVGGSGVYRLTNWMGSNQTFKYTNSYTYRTEKYFSLYANASYTFDKKYTISGSVRTDASNLITDDPKYRYAPFWSVGASWNAKAEKFLKDVNWLDRLVVRATYGYNGNVDRSTSFKPLLNVTTTQNSYINDYTASVSSYGNPTLRWEKTGSLDVGVDFSIFSSKLYGSVDVYSKQGKDLIVSMSIPSTNGTTSQKLNAAQMSNKGVEITLGSQMNVYGSDITWTGGLTFSYNNNEITSLFKSSYQSYDLYEGGSSAYVEGYNANTLWSYKYAGVKNLGSETSPIWRPVVEGEDGTYNQFTSWAPGDARNYMENSGTLVAPYTLGITSSFKIYDFNLSFIITGKFGHVFRGMSFNYPAMTSGYALPNKLYSEVLNSDPDKMIPIPFDGEERYYFWDRFYPYMDYLVQKAGHIRFQEVALSYNIPQQIIKKLRITKASVYAQANNLGIIQNNKYNEDPDYVMGTVKPTPAFTFGINLTF